MLENIYTNCIFCFQPLTECDTKPSVEHIVPQSLYGSICIKDVCILCNSRLGQTADFMAIEDARIVSAILTLDLPILKQKIQERGHGIAVDALDGTESAVKYKNGTAKTVTHRRPDGSLVSDERDWPEIVRNLLSKKAGNERYSTGRIDQIISQLGHRYSALSPGESTVDTGSGIGLRKRPVQVQPLLKTSDGACERLVAKIGYEFSFLVFDSVRLQCLRVLEKLSSVAMGNGSLDDTVLMYPPVGRDLFNSGNRRPEYFHQIILQCREFGYFIDIYFFGSVGFRLFLHDEAPEARGPLPHPDGDIDCVVFMMTFQPSQPIGKSVFIGRSGSDELEEYDGSDVL